jgi:DNA-binding beta-propeller fold protein YncE
LGENSWTLVAGNINGTSGDTSVLFISPVGLTLGPMGNLYAADFNNHRIRLFLTNRLNVTIIAGVTEQPNDNSILLNGPYTVALDNQLNLYVADNQNQHVQKFLRY